MKKINYLFLLMAMATIASCDERELNSPPLPPGTEDYNKQESSKNISEQEAIEMAEEIAADSVQPDSAELDQDR